MLNEEKVDAEITDEDLAAAEFLRDSRETLMKEIRKVIIGQQEVIDELLITLFSRELHEPCFEPEACTETGTRLEYRLR